MWLARRVGYLYQGGANESRFSNCTFYAVRNLEYLLFNYQNVERFLSNAFYNVIDDIDMIWETILRNS